MYETLDSHPDIASHTSIEKKKKIGLIAHDFRKKDLLGRLEYIRNILKEHELYGTDTAGRLIADQLAFKVHPFKSGPVGGNLQVGAAISESNLDILISFWDHLQAQPHDVDV